MSMYVTQTIDATWPLVGTLVHGCPTFKWVNSMTLDVQAVGIINTTFLTFALKRERELSVCALHAHIVSS